MKLKLNFTLILLFFIINKIICQNSILSNSELMVNSTIRIECYGDTLINGKKVESTSVGTGFYFEFLIDTLRIPVIVTNYHVIKNCEAGKLNFTESINGLPKYGSFIAENIYDFKNTWIKHPTTDLAILPLQPVINKIKLNKNKIPFYVSYTEDLLPTTELLDEMTAIEELFMIGYPQGLWDKTNNLPIVRKGITATPIYIDYEGKKQFLLDIAIFHGSSGSPVVLFNNGSYSTKKGGINIGGRLCLVGINFEGFFMEAEGKIKPQNNASTQISTNISINIANIIKSEELLDFKPILNALIKSDDRK